MNEVEKHQRVVADEILTKLHILDRTAILAGGALRSWVMGMPANDLDFYLYIPQHAELGMERTQKLVQAICDLDDVEFTQLGWDGQRDERVEHYRQMNHLVWVFECKYKDCTLQFMIMDCKTTKHCVDAFGCSLCKCYTVNPINPEFDIFLAEFVLSCYKKTILFSQNRSEKFLTKYKKYFPHFKSTDDENEWDKVPMVRNDNLLIRDYLKKVLVRFRGNL